MAKAPQPFVRRHEAFHCPAPACICGERPARQHHLERDKQLFGSFKIVDVARMVKSRQHLVRQSASLSGAAACGAANRLLDRVGHGPPGVYGARRDRFGVIARALITRHVKLRIQKCLGQFGNCYNIVKTKRVHER